MINLLPPQEKEKLIFESNKKLIVVLGNMTLVSLVSLALVLFSLKFYILEQLVLQKGDLSNTESEYQSKDFSSAKDAMQKYNGVIVKMNNFYKKEAYLSDDLMLISNITRPKGLYFDSINLDSSDNGDVNVKISGFSDTRENLQSFKDNLDGMQNKQSVNVIENVSFPSSVWLKARDIDFSITFKIVKNANQGK